MVNFYALTDNEKRLLIEAVQDGVIFVSGLDNYWSVFRLRSLKLLAWDEERTPLAYWLPTADARALVNDVNAKLEMIA